MQIQFKVYSSLRLNNINCFATVWASGCECDETTTKIIGIPPTGWL